MIRFRVAAALACVVYLASARSVSADVRSDQKSLVKFEGMIGRMVNLFGGKGARDGIQTTVMVKGNRKVTLNDSTGQIVDLDEEKIYDLDLKRKTYKVTTFAELRRQIEESRRRMEEEARKAQQEPRNAPAEPAPPRGKEEPQIEVDFDLKETGQRRTINGFDTHQVIMTITLREKGRTLEEGGGLVLTADNWLGPRDPAMNEVAEFDLRYARQFQSAILAGASAQDMAAAMAMYPMMKDALERMRAENVKLDGTGVLTTVTVDAAKSAAQMAEEARASTDQGSRASAPPTSVGGLLGGLARRAAKKEEAPSAPKQRLTFMTMTNELLKVTTDVSAAEVAIPAGFKENK